MATETKLAGDRPNITRQGKTDAWARDTTEWGDQIRQGLNAAYAKYYKEARLRGLDLLKFQKVRYSEIRDAFFAVVIDRVFNLDDRVYLTLFQRCLELSRGRIVDDISTLLYEICGDFFLTQEIRIGPQDVTGLGIDRGVAGHLDSIRAKIQFCFNQHPSVKRRLIKLVGQLNSSGKRRIPLLLFFSCFSEADLDDRTRTQLVALVRGMIATFTGSVRAKGFSQNTIALSDELRHVLWRLGPRLTADLAGDLCNFLLALDLALEKLPYTNEARSVINGPFDAALEVLRRNATPQIEERLFIVLRKFKNDYLKTDLLKAFGEPSENAAISDYLAQYLKIPYEMRTGWGRQVELTRFHEFIILSTPLAKRIGLKPEVYDYDEREDRCYVVRDHRTEAVWSLARRGDSRAVRQIITALRSSNADWRGHCLERIREDAIAHPRLDRELLRIINSSRNYAVVEDSVRTLVSSRPAKAITSLRRLFRGLDNGRRFQKHSAQEIGHLKYLAGCALLAVGDPTILSKLHNLYSQSGQLDALTRELVNFADFYAEGMFSSLVPYLGSREGPLTSLAADLILNTLISVSKSAAKCSVFDHVLKVADAGVKLQLERIIAQTPMNSEYVDWIRRGRMIVQPIFKTRGIAEKSRTCFVVMPFRKRWSKKVWSVVKAAFERAKFACWRADELTDQSVLEDIWKGLNEASVILVDLSGRNPNVFYEFGIAHTIGKQVIILTQTSDVPFDVNVYRWIYYKPTRSGLARLRRDLEKRIRSLGASSRYRGRMAA